MAILQSRNFNNSIVGGAAPPPPPFGGHRLYVPPEGSDLPFGNTPLHLVGRRPTPYYLRLPIPDQLRDEYWYELDERQSLYRLPHYEFRPQFADGLGTNRFNRTISHIMVQYLQMKEDGLVAVGEEEVVADDVCLRALFQLTYAFYSLGDALVPIEIYEQVLSMINNAASSSEDPLLMIPQVEKLLEQLKRYASSDVPGQVVEVVSEILRLIPAARSQISARAVQDQKQHVDPSLSHDDGVHVVRETHLPQHVDCYSGNADSINTTENDVTVVVDDFKHLLLSETPEDCSRRLSSKKFKWMLLILNYMSTEVVNDPRRGAYVSSFPKFGETNATAALNYDALLLHLVVSLRQLKKDLKRRIGTFSRIIESCLVAYKGSTVFDKLLFFLEKRDQLVEDLTLDYAFCREFLNHLHPEIATAFKALIEELELRGLGEEYGIGLGSGPANVQFV